jgi:hypothetical protein
MLTLLCILVATAPFAIVFGLLAWTSRRRRLSRDVQARQIALTDIVHERIGAAVAPVVRRGRRVWQVREIVLTRQPDAPATRPGARGVRRESLSWT